MQIVVGALDRTGSPTVTIRVTGELSSQEYIATIDTGFTGFIAMPVSEMVVLGLKIEGATTVVLGDGSRIDNLLAPRVTVAMGTQEASGTILLDEKSQELLIGLEFLRTFKLALILTSTTVVLYDEKETLESVVSFMRAAPIGTPNTNPTFVSSAEESK